MNYIWNEYSVDNTYCLARKDFSPYLECLNTQVIAREVNALFRFGSIFQCLMNHIQEDNDKKKELSLLFHILANYDLLSGLTELDIYMMMQEEVILAGYYGEKNKVIYESLSLHQKYILLKYMEQRRRCKSRKGYIGASASELLGAVLYYSCKSNYLLIFIPFKKDEKSAENSDCTFESLYQLWKSLFLDYWTEIEDVWKNHFGIIGFDSSMHIGELQLI